MLDVLDQHRASHRTVLSLAGGAVTAHLDPSYRMEKPVIRLRSDVVRKTLIALGTLAAVPALPQASAASSFSPTPTTSPGTPATPMATPPCSSHRTSACWPPMSAVSRVARSSSCGGYPAGLRRLSAFEGGVTVAIAPDSQLVATSSFQGQAALWSVARPRHPVWLGILPQAPPTARRARPSPPTASCWRQRTPAGGALGRVPAAPCAPAECANARVGPGMHGDIAFSPDGHLLAVASGHGRATIWNMTGRPTAARSRRSPAGAGISRRSRSRRGATCWPG